MIPIIIAGILLLFILEYFLIKILINKEFNNFETDLMDKYYKSIESTYKEMRGWRHDYHNHVQVMKAYLELKNYEDLQKYLDQLSDDIKNVDSVIKTGNILTDAILNTKISIANSKNIKLNVKAIIPKKNPLSDLELCVIISNLFENAIEGSESLKNESERFIRIYIDKLSDNLYISFTNSCLGKRKKKLGKFLTTKLVKNHGFGSERINAIAKKYSAYINRQSEEGVFCAELMIPLSKR